MCVHCSLFVNKSRVCDNGELTAVDWMESVVIGQGHWVTDGVTLHLSGFYATGRRDSWPGETSRQQARKLQWLHTAWSERWLLRPIDTHAIASTWSCGRASVHRVPCHHRTVTVSRCERW